MRLSISSCSCGDSVFIFWVGWGSFQNDAECGVVSIVDVIAGPVLNDFGDAWQFFNFCNDSVAGVASLEFVGCRKGSVGVNVERDPKSAVGNCLLESFVVVNAALFVVCDAGDFCNFLGCFKVVNIVEQGVDFLDFHFLVWFGWFLGWCQS